MASSSGSSRTCDECDQSFRYPSQLRRHVLNNHSEKHKCHKCPAQFNHLHELRTHVSSSHPRLQCSADGCSFRTNKKSELQKHADRMHSENSVLCTVVGCGVTTSYVRLRRHMINAHSALGSNEIQSSTGSSPHDSEDETVDEEVSRSFEASDQSVRQIACLQCGKRFFTQEQLKRHDRQVHQKAYKTYKREQKYECEECPKKFTTPGLLADHVAAHQGETPYECQRCEKKFAARARFAVHLNKYHAISIKDVTKFVHLQSEGIPG